MREESRGRELNKIPLKENRGNRADKMYTTNPKHYIHVTVHRKRFLFK
jgi:hypothetical protein